MQNNVLMHRSLKASIMGLVTQLLNTNFFETSLLYKYFMYSFAMKIEREVML